jgi:cytochrome P450
MMQYHPLDHAFLEDPYPHYARLREDAPVARNEELDLYALSRFDDVWNAVHDPATFSSAQGISLFVGTAEPPQLIEMDPPRHTNYRKLVSRTFTPMRVAAMEPMVRDLTRSWLDPLVGRSTFDAIGDFAAKLPMDVISTMLGVPSADHDRVRRWADQMLELDVDAGSPGAYAGGGVMAKMGAYFYALIAERRAAPRDDMISALVLDEIDGVRLSDVDVAGFCVLLAIAGNETTTKLIGHMLFHLATNPDQSARLDADPSLAARVVEETARYDASSQMLARTLTRDVELHGVTMRAGRKVALLIGSANRDEREFVHADRFDITREPLRTLAFGHGIHVCLGAALARLEGRVALEELRRRLPGLQVDTEGARRMHSYHVRGFTSLPVYTSTNG